MSRESRCETFRDGGREEDEARDRMRDSERGRYLEWRVGRKSNRKLYRENELWLRTRYRNVHLIPHIGSESRARKECVISIGRDGVATTNG